MADEKKRNNVHINTNLHQMPPEAAELFRSIAKMTNGMPISIVTDVLLNMLVQVVMNSDHYAELPAAVQKAIDAQIAHRKATGH